jgi:hypothetical protein
MLVLLSPLHTNNTEAYYSNFVVSYTAVRVFVNPIELILTTSDHTQYKTLGSHSERNVVSNTVYVHAVRS